MCRFSSTNNESKDVATKAAKAFSAAYKKSRDAGHIMVVVSGNDLIRINEDLSKEKIRTITGRKNATVGTTYKLR